MSGTASFDECVKELELGSSELRLARRIYRHVPPKGSQRVTAEKLLGAVASGAREEGHTRALLENLRKTGLVECTGSGYLKRTPLVGVKETYLYAPMKFEIENEWATQPGHNYHPSPQRFLRVFTNSGGTGDWERPDVTLIGGKTLPFIPGKFLDIITFEVKFWEDALKGLYEALAHRRKATHSYLVFFPPKETEGAVSWTKGRPEPWDPAKGPTSDTKKLRKITDEALRTDLGVIFATQEDDCLTWKELVTPVRYSPDPELLHDFVLSLIDRQRERYEERSALRNWLEASSFGDLTASQLDALELRPELRGLAKEFYREIPSKPEADTGVTCPEESTLADRLYVSREVAAEICRALQAAGHIETKSGPGRNGLFKTAL